MNAAFLSFEHFKVYIQECQQQLRTMGYNSRDIAHFQIWAVVLSFITLREPCNNQRPRCQIAWLHVTNHLYHGCPGLTFKQSQASRSII